jgi:uncharacterized iron-regulated membrane protein
MRKSFALVHRWVGLLLGLWIALVALSGIGMVFSTTFWAWEYGEAQTHVEMQDSPYAPPDIWLARAEERFGKLPNVEGFFGPRATPMRISAPTIIYTPTGTDKHGVVTVNPYTGEPLAHFIADDSWSFVPLWLHMSLFLGHEGSTWMLVILSIALTGFGISGLYLWWPGSKRVRAAAAIVKPNSPVNLRRFHAALGFWVSPLIMLAGITGLMLSKFDWAEAMTAPLGASAEFNPATIPALGSEAARKISAGDALAAAHRTYPGYELASMFLPIEGAPVYSMWLRPAGSTVPARGNHEVVVDARTGNVLFQRGDAEMQTGDTLLTYVVELHNGRLLGLFGEGLILVQGLAITILPLAGIGLWMWRRQRQRRKTKYNSATEFSATGRQPAE